MNDLKTAWRAAETQHERLRWARLSAPLRGAPKLNGAEAARRLGLTPETYRAYERRPDASKSIEYDHRLAMAFGRLYKVRWEWLLSGEGEPLIMESLERVLRVMSRVTPQQQEALADAMERLLNMSAD